MEEKELVRRLIHTYESCIYEMEHYRGLNWIKILEKHKLSHGLCNAVTGMHFPYISMDNYSWFTERKNPHFRFWYPVPYDIYTIQKTKSFNENFHVKNNKGRDYRDVSSYQIEATL